MGWIGFSVVWTCCWVVVETRLVVVVLCTVVLVVVVLRVVVVFCIPTAFVVDAMVSCCLEMRVLRKKVATGRDAYEFRHDGSIREYSCVVLAREGSRAKQRDADFHDVVSASMNEMV